MMAQKLPEGLISTQDHITGDITHEDGLEVEDIQKLWKSYSANRAVIADNVGRRLENLFWRIWSNERVLNHISGIQVASQFSLITEGGTFEDRLLTPTQSPRSSRSLGSYYYHARSRDTEDASNSTPPAGHVVRSEVADERDHSFSADESTDGNETPTPASPLGETISSPIQSAGKKAGAGDAHTADAPTIPASSHSNVESSNAAFTRFKSRRGPATQPPPILKKATSSASSKSSMSSRFGTPTPNDVEPPASASNVQGFLPGDEDFQTTDQQLSFAMGSPPAKRYTSTRFSEEVAVSIPKTSGSVIRATEKVVRLPADGTQKPAKRNPVVLANSGASKKRPSFVRQRSAQVASDASRVKPSPSPPNSASATLKLQSISTNTTKALYQDLETTSSDPSSSRSPSSAAGLTQPGPDIEALAEEPDEHMKPQLGGAAPLAGPDFRSQFVDQKAPRYRSFTSLPSFARKSEAVTATAASYQATGLLDLGQASPFEKGKGKDAFHHEIVRLKPPAPLGPRPSKEETCPVLPRTKSQLTMLLERSESSLGSGPSRNDGGQI